MPVTMPIPVLFDKTRVEDILESISTGEPITPAGGYWHLATVMEIAGVMLAVVSARAGDDCKDSETLDPGLTLAVKAYCGLTMAVMRGDYDEKHEPSCSAAVVIEGNQIVLRPLDGFKGEADAADGGVP